MRFCKDFKTEILNAGHPPIIRIKDKDTIEELKFDTQLPLLTLRNSEYNSNTIETRPGELFVIYSDGITETTNKKGSEFGFQRLRDTLQDSFSLSTREISQKVYRQLISHGSSKDDQSIIFIQNK
jgi:sigma-B regulation protein RsbU (phosphoserine phosphatase)